MTRVALLCGYLCGLGVAAASPETSASPGTYFGDPAQQIEFFNVRHLAQTKRLVLPTLYVRVMQWSRDESGAAPVEIESPIAVETARAAAATLYDDLAARLRAAGWDVITHDAIKDHAAFSRLPRVAPDRILGVPVDATDENRVAQRHAVIAPAGQPVIQTGATGPIWAMKDVLRELDAGALILTCTFDVVAGAATPLSADENESTTAPVPVPRLRLSQIGAEFYSTQLIGGWMRARDAQLMAEPVGIFAAPGDKPARGGNPFARALGGLTNLGSRRKDALALIPDEPAVQNAAIGIGRAFIATCVRTITPYAPKS